MANNTNTSRSPIYLASGLGDIFSLTDVRGIRLLQDGRIVLKSDTENPVIMLDPSDYEGVTRDEVIGTFKHLLLDYASNKPVILPEWMKKILEA